MLCNSTYKIISHPADTGIEIESADLECLFRAALAGFNATVFQRPGEVDMKEEKRIEVTGEDVKELLVNFLSEVLILLDSERFVAGEVEFKKINETNLEAVLKGGPVDLEKMGFITEIKAVTYHRLEVKKTNKGWWARVIFDI